MTPLVILILAQSAVFAAILWAGVRRMDDLLARIARLEDALGDPLVARARAAKRRARAEPALAGAGARARVDDPDIDYAPPDARRRGAEPDLASAARYRRSPPLIPANDFDDEGPVPARPGAGVSPETVRALAAATLLAAPGVAAAFAAPAGVIIAATFVLVAAAFVAAMRPAWRAAAWAGAVAGGGWALAGLAAGAAHAEPMLYAGAALLAGAIGLAHARFSDTPWPGATLAVLMAGASLSLGVDTAMVGPAGAAFGGIALLAALAGASATRLEPIHIGAFGALGVGLYVLSGQPAGDVWFTPAAAWTGGAFAAIAAARAPKDGARAALVAATGAIAPVFAVSVMIEAGHGLESRWAGAATFALLAAMFFVLLGAAARRHGGVAELRLTGWALGLAGVWCAGSATIVAIPAEFAPFAACALAGLAVCAALVDLRAPAQLWRFAAASLVVFALGYGWQAASAIGLVNSPLPALGAIAAALLAPALLALGAARVTETRGPSAAAVLEVSAMLGAAAGASALIRFAFSGEALWFTPIGFVETGAHATAWLLLALGFAARADRGARAARGAMAFLLASAGSALALGAGILSGVGRVSLSAAETGAGAVLTHPPLGLAAPAAAAGALWVFFRLRRSAWPTHASRTAAAFLAAGWATMEAAFLAPDSDWPALGVGALAFAGAIAAALLPMRAAQAPSAA